MEFFLSFSMERSMVSLKIYGIIKMKTSFFFFKLLNWLLGFCNNLHTSFLMFFFFFFFSLEHLSQLRIHLFGIWLWTPVHSVPGYSGLCPTAHPNPWSPGLSMCSLLVCSLGTHRTSIVSSVRLSQGEFANYKSMPWGVGSVPSCLFFWNYAI